LTTKQNTWSDGWDAWVKEAAVGSTADGLRTGEGLHKNADLATFTQEELNAVAAKLNQRPLRVLGWAAPAEAFGAAEPTPMLRAPA
jgi:hypothetical protein